MAIKPEQAKALTEEEKRIISRLEKKIDSTIKDYDITESTEIEWEIPSNIDYRYRILNEIKERYKNAGWNVWIQGKERPAGGIECENCKEQYNVLKLKPKKIRR